MIKKGYIFLWMVVLVDQFLLSNSVEVDEIFMKYGLLHIDLKRALSKAVIQKLRLNKDKQMKDQFGVLEDRIVYLKPIDKADVPDEVFEETGDIDQLWSVHNSDGEQLALVGDLNQAYDMAREFSYSPMTLH